MRSGELRFGAEGLAKALVLAALLLALSGVACGKGGGSRQEINIDGSSTVFPITEAVAEEFGKLAGGKVRVTVGVSGTGGGFQKFCNGETDLTNASRPIKASEASLCAQTGIKYIELPVALDGLTVAVNPSNDFVACLTLAELRAIWAPQAEGKLNRWSQVRPGWPDVPLQLYGPGVDSGTFDYFTEVVNGAAQASRGDFTSSEDDNVLVQGVVGDKHSLGYFGYAYYRENAARLRAVAIDGGGGCVAPTEESVTQGRYTPLSRPLFLYVREDVAFRPQVREFVLYYLGERGREMVAEVGYISFPARVYELLQERFKKGTTGTLFGGDNPQRGSVEAVLSANP